jgi:hypothetical protein
MCPTLMAQRHDKTNNELGLLLGAIVWPDTRAVEPVTGSITLKSGLPTRRTMPEDYDPRPGVPPHSSRRQALMSAHCRSEKLCVDLCHAVVASHACDEVVCSAVLSVSVGHSRFDESSTRIPPSLGYDADGREASADQGRATTPWSHAA